MELTIGRDITQRIQKRGEKGEREKAARERKRTGKKRRGSERDERKETGG